MKAFNPIQDGEAKSPPDHPFATPVQNFKFLPSASPKLLNLNQDHPSKKAIFLVKSL